jgi:hypothetical protein
MTPEVWTATLLSQRALRALEPEQTIPLWLAREWAYAAAKAGEVHPPAQAAIAAAEAIPGVQEALLALTGIYVKTSTDGAPLGPFNTMASAAAAGRAAMQHGAQGWEIIERQDLEAVICAL